MVWILAVEEDWPSGVRSFHLPSWVCQLEQQPEAEVAQVAELVQEEGP